MRFWELVRHALEGVRRTPLRSALTALGVAIAAGSLVCMVAFALGLEAQVEAPFHQLGLLHHIQVQPKDAPVGAASEGGADGGDDRAPPPLDDAALARLAALPDVDGAYPDFRLAQVELSHAGETVTAYAVGLPREASLLGFLQDFLRAGRLFSLSSEPEILIGVQVCRDLGFAKPEDAVDETLTVFAAGLTRQGADTFDFVEERLDMRITGVFEPPSIARGVGSGAAVLPVDLMRRLPGVGFEAQLQRLRTGSGPSDPSEASASGYAQVVVRVRDPADVPDVARMIEDMGYETHALADELSEMRTFFALMEVLLASVGTVALVVAGLGILNTLLMAVLERYQEIGIYKAMGASGGDVRVIFLTEASVVGFLGGLGGLVLARIVSWILELGINAYLRGRGIDGPLVVFHFPLWLLAGAVLFAIVASVASGLHPASRAARVDPIRALRRE